jgi:hypothetical protein
MLLSCAFLTQVADVNNFVESPKVFMTEGDTIDIYLQLRDMAVNSAGANFNPPGRRFVPAAGATLQVTIDHIDNARKIVKFASQPFPGDLSIWKISIAATDKIVGTRSLKLVLNEGGKLTNGIVHTAIYSTSLNASA